MAGRYGARVPDSLLGTCSQRSLPAHVEQCKRTVLRGHVCDMHANSDDILSICYL